MKLIVGLGNPGDKYKNNRHNVGFMFIDYIMKNLQILNYQLPITNQHQILNDKYQKNPLTIIYRLSPDLILAKPQTFMNNSGLAVIGLIKNFKLKIENLIVIHDDLDIPLGKFKIQSTGPRLHNGLDSIEKCLLTKDFLRVRVGVDARPSNDPTRIQQINSQSRMVSGETYVLSDFIHEERKLIDQVFNKIFTQLKTYL